MADLTLADVSQVQFDAAEQTLMSMIRTTYPTLDMRRGTVIRDLLIRPAAAVYAYNADNMTTLSNKMSLVTLAQDPTATAADYNAVLANLGATMLSGVSASGQIIVTVDSSRVYNFGANTLFTDINGNQYQTLTTVVVSPGATGSEIPLNANSDGNYYFILPLWAVLPGSAQNIAATTALTPVSPVYGFISAEAYSPFSGGTDAETIDEVTQRLPASLSYRALESATSIDAKLRNAFEGTLSLQAINVSGYGKRTQLRDKHNPMGFAVGSRVDIYARTYATPRVVTLQKTGTLVAPSTYQITITAADAPGFSFIRSISEVEATVAPTLTFGTLTVAGSYPFAEVRSASGLTNTTHDIDTANSVIETAYTKYQQATILVTSVAAGTATHDFKVELYAADGILALQDYVDDPSISNVEADYIVRSPLMCMIGLQAGVYVNRLNPVSADTLKSALLAYINGRSFVTQITRSELVNVMLSAGARRVDLSEGGMKLYGSVRDAAGVIHAIAGDSISIEQNLDASVMLAPETTVFATEASQLQIEVISE